MLLNILSEIGLYDHLGDSRPRRGAQKWGRVGFQHFLEATLMSLKQPPCRNRMGES